MKKSIYLSLVLLCTTLFIGLPLNSCTDYDDEEEEQYGRFEDNDLKGTWLLYSVNGLGINTIKYIFLYSYSGETATLVYYDGDFHGCYYYSVKTASGTKIGFVDLDVAEFEAGEYDYWLDSENSKNDALYIRAHNGDVYKFYYEAHTTQFDLPIIN